MDAVLVKRSKRANNADCAPYYDRWLLRDVSKRQPSLLQWAEKNEFTMLADITSTDVDRWRNTWVFREESYSLKNSNARIKAFFTWAEKFEHLDKNPFDKLDKLKLTAVPTVELLGRSIKVSIPPRRIEYAGSNYFDGRIWGEGYGCLPLFNFLSRISAATSSVLPNTTL